MATIDLSSNWKRLQATIKAQPSRKKEIHIIDNHQDEKKVNLKRKSIPGQTYSANKKQKASATQWRPTKTPRPKMGGMMSAEAASTSNAEKENSTNSTSKPTVAHPIPQDEVSSEDEAPINEPSAQVGKYIAIDCEMVGTHSITPLSVPAHNQKANSAPEYSILARVSIVNYAGQTLYDTYVLPPPGVTISDYRTRWSGITPHHLDPNNTNANPKPFEVAQAEVAALLTDRVLIGHAIKNDLEVLGLSHPRRDIRDTSRHPKFRALTATTPGGKGRTPSLKRLSEEVLGLKIQGDDKRGHSSVEDARATMALFKKEKADFEREHAKIWGRERKGRGERVGKEVVVGGNEVVEVAKVERTGGKVVKGSVKVDEEDGEEEGDDEETAGDDSEEEDDDDSATGHAAAPSKKKKKKKKKTKHKSRTKRA